MNASLSRGPRGSRHRILLPLLTSFLVVACASSSTNTNNTTKPTNNRNKDWSPEVTAATPPPSSSSPSESSARLFIGELARGEWDHSKTPFDQAMAKAMSPEQLHVLWGTLEKDGGAFREVESTRLQSKDGYQIVLTTCRFEHVRRIVRLVFDQDKKVAGLFHGPVPEDLEAKTRRLVDAASTGKFEVLTKDLFNKEMREALPASKLSETWKQLESKLGRVKEIEKIDLKPERGYWISRATAKFEHEDSRFVIKIVYDGRDEIAGLFFEPPTTPWSEPAYAKTTAFEEREVTIGTAPALPGTLTVPKGTSTGTGTSTGPFPAVVLVHGSGPNDQDESVGAIKPFKDLAWGLASKGIAVVRYVKRSKHSPSGIVTQKEEVLDGAHEAIELLRKTPNIDPKRIFVIGHSQGGYLAPRIAEANPSLAGVVIMAGSTIPLEDSMVDQLTYFKSLDPTNKALQAQLDSAVKFKQTLASRDLHADQDLALPLGGTVKGAYFLDVRGYEPHVLAAKLSCRLLVLQGERDYQVTMTKDFAGWKKTLGSKKSATFRTYPSLNHLFVSGTGTPSPAEYQNPGHVDEHVVSDIASWIQTTI